MGSHGVCVFSERRDVALELLAAARTLAGEKGVVSLLLAPDGQQPGGDPFEHGADIVAIAGANNGADPAAIQLGALRRILDRYAPEIVLIGATAHGTEIAARLAQGLRVGCAAECTRLERTKDGLVIERTCLGRFVARQVIRTRPAIATVQPRRFEPAPVEGAGNGTVERFEIEAPASRTPILETRPRARSRVRMDKAAVVVGIGRGLRSKDDLPMVEELARVLGGVVGASRPLTDDLQWLEPDRKIGLSGVTVKPSLYIACGISGQIEHNVGMRESGVVVAVNNDPSAPILKQADYCVTADLHEMVPALIEAIGKMAGRDGDG